jgi:hypothetical protein
MQIFLANNATPVLNTWIATPPMWQMRIVGCVPGSPIDCACGSTDTHPICRRINAICNGRNIIIFHTLNSGDIRHRARPLQHSGQ